MRKLVIDRNVWLRSEGNIASKLVRSKDGKQCCVGIYLLACGVPKEAITDRGEPHSYDLPDEAKWIEQRRYEDTQYLYSANDNYPKEEADKQEHDIAKIFLRHDIEVEFVN